MMTQKQRAQSDLTTISVYAAKRLRKVLEEAQSAPPAGSSDGTIKEEAWTELRTVVNALETIDRTLKHSKHWRA